MTALTDRLDSVLSPTLVEPLQTAFAIVTVEDLLRHYPTRYVRAGQELGRADPDDGEHITVVGTVTKADLVAMRARRGHMLRVSLACDGQSVSATFFNGHKVKHSVRLGARVMFSGTVKYFNGRWSLNHPAYLILDGAAAEGADELVRSTGRGGGALAGMARGARDDGGEVDMTMFDLPFLPMYSATREIESWTILGCVRRVLDALAPVDDPLPDHMRLDRGLLDLDSALRGVHFPRDTAEIDLARDRLRFDEAVSLQLVLAERRALLRTRSAHPCLGVEDGIADRFSARLPFELTDGQRVVAQEIAADIASDHPMSRLLQGEVGSGKTIVALRAMLTVVDAGYQCALLAPTEVLAAQHVRSIRAMLGPLGCAGELGADERATRVELLLGSQSTAARRAALLSIVSGDAGIVIGTHALIQDSVEFFDLGLVVIDEQHRFGVEQRESLRAKARSGNTPHLLVMTATPIPRTIAMTTLGDLETSTLTELPRGRSPIVTNVVPVLVKPAWVDRVWARIREEVGRGRQSYVVCARIGDENEDAPPLNGPPPPTAALAMFETLATDVLADLRVGLLHGRLPTDEKDATMTAFTAGEIDVLVCTTVVEVGVDVPNATVMVISDAERFGVSQLHQLRGRIGRGGHQGLCILMTKSNPAAPAMGRLEAVAATTDGFELALLDLRQRREGDVLGAAQSGTTSTLRLLSLLDHADVIADARGVARAVVDSDPDLSAHPGLRNMTRAAVATDRLDFLDKN